MVRKQVTKQPRNRRALPVLVWLQAGAVAGGMGILLAAAPAATADDGGPDSGPTASTRSGGDDQSPIRGRRSPQPAPVTGSVAGPDATGPAGAPATGTAKPAGARPSAAVRAVPIRAVPGAAAPSAKPAPPPAQTVTTALTTPVTAPQAVTDASIRLAVLGDAGNSHTNGTNYYYAPGAYRRTNLGASGPMQQAVAEMMRSWNPSDVVQLGDESYNVASSTLLDYNIGQYYNDWIYPYVPPAFTQSGSIYTDATLGGVQAVPGKTQWPYNVYNFPNGFPNPADPTKPGGSPDGVNHYWAVPGNHDEATILGKYNDASVNQVNFDRDYIGPPIGPDAWDYQNNIKDTPTDTTGKIDEKTGSTQSLIDYHTYLTDADAANLKPGTLTIGKIDPDGYGIYYGVNLGDAGDGRPLIHMTIIDTSRLLTDAGFYDFDFAPNTGNKVVDPITDKEVDKRTKILNYDVSTPVKASQAWFQDPTKPGDGPSIGREMFLWAKQDLENSDAVWNFVMGHHPAYHVGSTRQSAEDSYTSNAVILNLLKGLKDDAGVPLFDAFMNGHSHAYARTLEMTPSANGIGTGIPFLTIGDGGKSLDSLNLAPYGTSTITPINYFNIIGRNPDGSPIYNWNPLVNGFGDPTDPEKGSEAAALAPYQAANPTSVGLSGFYSYSTRNFPDGSSIYDPSKPRQTNPADWIVTSDTTDPNTGAPKQFKLTLPAYLSSDYPDKPGLAGLSGLYGFGSGAAQVDAGDSYLMIHYKTAQPIDPAIALIGRSQGVTSFDSNSLFYKQWSPSTAKVADLAMFSFDVDANGSVTNVQLVKPGNGYMESDPAASSYLDITQNFEILGNNPANPLGFNVSDPTRAVVALTFSGGKLTAANLVNPGSAYQQVTNAILQQNNPGTAKYPDGTAKYPNGTVAYVPADPKQPIPNNSLLVGVNIDLQGQYTLAASRAAGTDPYHDWYLTTDTGVASGNTSAAGDFGAVKLTLQPSSPTARQLITDTPLTTGYNGKGTQQKYLAPQTGTLTLVDSLGQQVGTATVAGGEATVTLNQLAAPGPLRIQFSGDSTSSYQVNYRRVALADNVQVGLDYGTWTGPITQQGSQLQLADTQTMQVTRTDSGSGLVTFGLSNGSASTLLASRAAGANTGSLQAVDLFATDPSLNWQSTEHRSEGGTGSARVNAGTWTPTARLNGSDLTLVDLQTTANGALARFAAGNPNDTTDDVLATFTLPNIGTTTAAQNGVLTVRRLSGNTNSVALYEADPVTGAVVDSKGRTFKPGQIGYLTAALENAKSRGLVVNAQDMPAFGQTAELTSLPLNLSRNYGALLLVNGSERNLISSYAAANPFQSNQSLSLVAPDRGVSFGFEDLLPWQWGSDLDYNDVIVTLTPAVPTVTTTSI